MDTNSTYSSESVKPFTLDDIKRAAYKMSVGAVVSNGHGKKKTWFERLMNKYGWYRSSEWYLLNPNKFGYWPTLLSQAPVAIEQPSKDQPPNPKDL